MKTPSISREARQRIAERASEIRNFKPQVGTLVTDYSYHWTYRPFTPTEARDVAHTLDTLAEFWLKHPNLWVRGNELVKRQGVWKMCNIGVLTASIGGYDGDDYYPNSTTIPSLVDFDANKKAVSFTLAYEGFLMDINDGSKTVEENIAGLRIMASVLRAYAELPQSKRAKTSEWEKLVDAAFAQNLKLLKVQSQRYLKAHPRATAWKKKMNHVIRESRELEYA